MVHIILAHTTASEQEKKTFGVPAFEHLGDSRLPAIDEEGEWDVMVKARVLDVDHPFRLCPSMGIFVDLMPLGSNPNAIKGFFLRSHRISRIIINSDLPHSIQRIIAAHELGHAILHKDSGVNCFRDLAIYDESSVLEKDANIFAAEYLMEDKDVLHHLNEDGTFFLTARALNVPMELLDFKLRMMKWRGYKLVEAPIMSKSNYLKDMEVPENDDYHIC